MLGVKQTRVKRFYEALNNETNTEFPHRSFISDRRKQASTAAACPASGLLHGALYLGCLNGNSSTSCLHPLPAKLFKLFENGKKRCIPSAKLALKGVSEITLKTQFPQTHRSGEWSHLVSWMFNSGKQRSTNCCCTLGISNQLPQFRRLGWTPL